MNSIQRFYILLSILAILFGAMSWCMKQIWKAAGKYQASLDALNKASDHIEDLGDDLKELIRLKEREHDRIDTRITTVESKVERHEQWHLNERK